MEKERVLIVGVDDGSRSFFEYFLEELEGLVEAAEGVAISDITQKVKRINPATVIGSGKLIELKPYIDELDIETIVFSCELTGSQLRNLEDELECKVLDRTMLILDIFARRATSREGKLQVHLAQLEYRLPRLVGMRSALSRLGGGIGTRGPGEQQLETDRRHIQREIDRIKKRLEDVERHRKLHRQHRQGQDILQVAMVGYTNAGKSTIINGLLKLNKRKGSDVFVKDMVFATLEPSLRRIVLPKGTPIIVADTVGFVTQLPTTLIEAFKGTLDEINEADLLVHVVDGSDKELASQIETTLDILEELEAISIPRLTVINKIDQVTDEDRIYFGGIDKDEVLEISALKSADILKLAEAIERTLAEEGEWVKMLIDYDCGNLVDRLLQSGRFHIVAHELEGSVLEGILRQEEKEFYRAYILEGEHGIQDTLS